MENQKIHNLKKVCVQCGKEFHVRGPSELEIRINCSKKCQIEATRKNKTKLKCLICDKEIYVLPCLIEKTKYCSRKCKGIDKRKIKEEGIRQCNKCKEILSLSNFGSKEYICRVCRSLMAKMRCRTEKGRFACAGNIANRRNMEWTITKDQYKLLMSQKCNYCNCDLNPTGTGLDRMNNKKGYTIDNVVPCCSACNVTRSDNYSYEEMLLLAETIKKIKFSRITNGY